MNVQEWGCFSNFLRSDDVTRTMSKGGGVLVKNLLSVPGPPPFKNPGSAPEVLCTECSRQAFLTSIVLQYYIIQYSEKELHISQVPVNSLPGLVNVVFRRIVKPISSQSQKLPMSVKAWCIQSGSAANH